MGKFPLIDIRNGRLDKIAKLRALGIDPFPSSAYRTHYAKSILDEYDKIEGKDVTVAGRLMSWRPHGKLTFGHIQDQTERIQLLFARNELKATNGSTENLGYDDLNLIDIGDIVEAMGTVSKTRRGEISIIVKTLRLLTKTIRPLPDKWVGLRDREAILRRRYLDTITQPDHRKPFELISCMIHAIRDFLDAKGFVEINTPVLQPEYGGGTAKPFVTHVNALNCDMFLAISHELYLKRLIAAGFDKVYTIGRYFRNEGIDSSHHPEFSMIETMTAYENYEYNMNLVEELFKYIAKNVFGKTKFNIKGKEVDFNEPWERILLTDALKRETDIDFTQCNSIKEANNFLKSLGIEDSQPSIGAAMFKAFDDIVAPTILKPTLVYGHPMAVSPLAKPMVSNPDFAERFEIIIGGMECGDNWSEQNDPTYLLERWKKAYEALEVDPEEFHPLDYDFIEVLEYGIPPTTGIGPGIERMTMIFTEQENIDDVIFFPMMKPVLSPLNAAIYGIEELPYNTRAGAQLVLDIEKFKEMVEEQTLKAALDKITIRPYINFLDNPSNNGIWRASGHIDVEGFTETEPLTILGYNVKSEEALIHEEEKKRFIDMIDLEVVKMIKKKYSHSKVILEAVVHISY
ncbi:MAG: lysine--tRNA ligase [Desulfobacterales bacterium]|nr:lysine--tRNA ligase [Desulfobacterales bacterium]